MTNLQKYLTKIIQNEQAKSSYLKVAQGFICMEQDITFQAVFGPVGSTEAKKFGLIMSNF